MDLMLRGSDMIDWVVVENDAPYNFNTLAIDDAEQSILLNNLYFARN